MTELWVCGLSSSSLHQFSGPSTPSFQPPSLQSTQIRLDGAWATPPGSCHLNPAARTQWSTEEETTDFHKAAWPAVSCRCLLPTAAWPLRAPCTQNYHVLTQAGAHGKESHVGRHTPRVGRHRGHSEAEVTRVYSFSRGGLKYNFQEDCIMDYCLRKLWQRTTGSLSFPKGAFPPQGLREAREVRRLLPVFYSDLGCHTDNVWVS